MKYSLTNTEDEQSNSRGMPSDGAFIKNVIDRYNLNSYKFTIEEKEGYRACGEVNLEISNM